MGKVLCIDSNELYDLIGRGYSPKELQQMTLEEIENDKGRPIDTEDMQYVDKTECLNCGQNCYCGEYRKHS